MQLALFLKHAIEQLKQTGVDNPKLDARLLTGHALNLDRAELLSQSQRVLSETEITAINALLKRRAQRESVARIIGSREFWGLEFGLNEATLEPRPDSETLIEAVGKCFPLPPLGGEGQSEGSGLVPELHAPPHPAPSPPYGGRRAFPRILDLGTGTGCLLLALLHEMPEATGTGIDINPRAVEQATKNAATLGLGKRAAFFVGNWLSNLTKTFDIIVSNPPYIPAADISALMPEVRNYDPLLALDGGDDGLAPYRFLLPQLEKFLNPQGLAAFEVGQGQAPQVAALFQQNGFTNIAVHKDLGSVARCVTGQLQSSRLVPQV